VAAAEKKTISLPSDLTSYIDPRVKAGDYALASEVIRAGSMALKERDETVERWLQMQVASSFDAMLLDPARAVPVDDAFSRVRARHAGHLKGQK